MSLTVKEIKEKLIDLGLEEKDFVAEDGKKKKKAELLAILEQLEVLDDAQVVEEEGDTPEQEKDLPPEIGSRAWTDYVLNHLDDDEKINGNPTVDGLRRVILCFMGEYNFQVQVLQVPSVENQGRATVKASLFFENGRIFESAADVFHKNTDYPYNMHPVATAETRAEGRALRKALKLVKVVTAEELAENAEEDVETSLSKKIDSSMLDAIRTQAKRNGISIDKLAVTIDQNIESVEDLTLRQGRQMMEMIHKYKEEGIPKNVALD